ncbi:MAG: type II toxin-antitoxin system prevent-host-death family antitoxin [Halioglobus sp.]|nr:type II toxin-antitoxin system prevent-host-death family antitoxin [Halioglobus sp.]
MKEEIGSYDAKTKLSEILRRVEAGESFTITNRGKPVAEIIPTRSSRQRQVETAITNILNARKQVVSSEELAELKEQGRQ